MAQGTYDFSVGHTPSGGEVCVNLDGCLGFSPVPVMRDLMSRARLKSTPTLMILLVQSSVGKCTEPIVGSYCRSLGVPCSLTGVSPHTNDEQITATIAYLTF